MTTQSTTTSGAVSVVFNPILQDKDSKESKEPANPLSTLSSSGTSAVLGHGTNGNGGGNGAGAAGVNATPTKTASRKNAMDPKTPKPSFLSLLFCCGANFVDGSDASLQVTSNNNNSNNNSNSINHSNNNSSHGNNGSNNNINHNNNINNNGNNNGQRTPSVHNGSRPQTIATATGKKAITSPHTEEKVLPAQPTLVDVTAAQEVDEPALASPQSQDIEMTGLLGPIAPEHKGRKCLVLDLDETLVHSSFKLIPQADYVVPVEIDNQSHNVYVIKRPGVDTFLKQMGDLFEVVIFTASLSKYADPVLDMLDIHKVIKHRLFRESCFNHKGNYVKDLSVIGRDLRNAIIIDNSPASYIFHQTNAVPISSWFNDPHDTELLDLIPFLADLTVVTDVNPILDMTNDEGDDNTNGFDSNQHHHLQQSSEDPRL
ncbi:hypothetical protein DFQ26_000434 [Actinomortierella ambigua]|nr:hypothetical protein DFQ26_000434 [Actinomortierella ambigua]